MQVSSVVQFSTQQAQQRNQEAAEVAVHKKAIDIMEQNALALLEAVPEIPAQGGAPVGQVIDVSV